MAWKKKTLKLQLRVEKDIYALICIDYQDDPQIMLGYQYLKQFEQVNNLKNFY